MSRAYLLLLTAGLAFPSYGTAQAVTDVQITRSGIKTGDDVRLQAGALSGEFKVIDIQADGLTVVSAQHTTPVAIPFSAIGRLDVKRGRSARAGALRGAGLGFLIGGGAGVIAGYADGDDPPSWFSFTAEEKAALLGIAGGGVGVIVGAAIGAVSPGKRWQPVGKATALSVAPISGGLAITVTRAL